MYSVILLNGTDGLGILLGEYENKAAADAAALGQTIPAVIVKKGNAEGFIRHKDFWKHLKGGVK